MYICIAMWKFRYMYGQCASMFESITLLYSKMLSVTCLEMIFVFKLFCVFDLYNVLWYAWTNTVLA